MAEFVQRRVGVAGDDLAANGLAAAVGGAVGGDRKAALAADLQAASLRTAVLRAAGWGLLGMVSTPLVFALAGRLDRNVGNVEGAGLEENGNGFSRSA